MVVNSKWKGANSFLCSSKGNFSPLRADTKLEVTKVVSLVKMAKNMETYPHILIHCILVDSSTVIHVGWTSLFVILGASGLFCLFCRLYSILDGNPVSKQCRA